MASSDSNAIVNCISQLAICSKEMENELLKLENMSAKVLQSQEWYSDEIIEIFQGFEMKEEELYYFDEYDTKDQ